MDITLDDFIQKYRNTYVFLKTASGNILTEFIEADRHLTFYEPDIGAIQVTFDNACRTIITKFPESGIYNFGDILFGFIYRHPERQFKASPCNGNTRIETVYTGDNQPVNFLNIKEAFLPFFPKNKNDAIKLIDKRGGVALNNRIGLTISNDDKYDLYYQLVKIGSIDANDNIKVTNTTLLQEVKDFFGGLQWTN